MIPELLLRILLIGYLYGITSERKLVEELRMHLRGAGSRAWVSIRKSRITPRSRKTHMDGFRNRNSEELFEQIVKQCVEVGLVQGKHLSVDGSFVEANAAKESRIPRLAVNGSGASEPNRAPVPGRTGAAESGGGAGA